MVFRFFVREENPSVFVAYDQAHPEVTAEGPTLSDAIFKLSQPMVSEAAAVIITATVEPEKPPEAAPAETPATVEPSATPA